MKKNNTNLILVISSIIFLILLGISVYFLNVIKNKNKHISAVLSTLEGKMIEKENIKTLEKKMAELGDTHRMLGSYFVDAKNIDVFVEYLEKMGVSNNLDLSVSGVDVPKGEKNKIIVSSKMSGNFTDIMKVISLLENSPYNITIDSTYINKEIVVEPENINSEVKKEITVPIKEKSIWQATITFSVLSLQ